MTKISRRAALLGLMILVATALYGAVDAGAAGSFAAQATRPSYDTGSLELTGTGGYSTARARAELRVTVCLQKRLGHRSFPIRCETGAGTGTQVSAEVAVPGCVAGVWRTTSTGEARDPGGNWGERASTTSAPFHC